MVGKASSKNETSDGQAAAGVSDMGEQQREEVDSEGRPSLGGEKDSLRAGVDLDPTVVVAEAGAVGMECERESVGLWAAV